MNKGIIKDRVGDWSVDKIASICCILLIYVMGKFQLADLFGIKRIVQFILFIPILSYLIIKVPDMSLKRHFNPLVGLVILMLCVNMYFHMNLLWLFDYLFSIVGLLVLLTVSRKHIIISVKWVVSIATIFAALALIQFPFLVIFPDLAVYTRLGLLDEGYWTSINPSEGASVVTSVHPIAYFGLMTYDKLNVFGFEISRMRSFTSEPSLLVAYFLFPATFGLFLKSKFWARCSFIIIIFCLLSFSGSVQLCLVASVLYILASIFFPTRFIFISFPILILAITLGAMLTFGLDMFTAFDANLAGSESTDFLAKGNSLVIRATGLIDSVNEAFTSPLGSSYVRDLPLSILLSSMLSAGWLGAGFLLLFFYKLIVRLDLMLKLSIGSLNVKLGAAVLFGITCTVFLFNDYAMLNYAGIIFLMLTYRLLAPTRE